MTCLSSNYMILKRLYLQTDGCPVNLFYYFNTYIIDACAPEPTHHLASERERSRTSRGHKLKGLRLPRQVGCQ